MANRNTERQDLIDLLVFVSGRAETFYQNMTDEQLTEEYDRLNNRPPITKS